jgi:hypothetical protein
LRFKNARALALAPLALLSLAACSPEQIARHLARDGQVATSVDGEGVAEHLESVAFRDQEADRLARSNGARGTCSETGIFFAESGGDWKAENAVSTASGGYQFLDSTWAGHGGYAHASDAPPHVQRERFLALWADGAGASHWTESVC